MLDKYQKSLFGFQGAKIHSQLNINLLYPASLPSNQRGVFIFLFPIPDHGFKRINTDENP
jgi:hypothetical protein